MLWQEQLRADPFPWLFDADAPGVRYLALRDLGDLAPTDPQLAAARRAAHRAGPIAAILAEMDAAGFWVGPGPGYLPKYRSTVWSAIMLAQLGASVAEDARVGRACAYLLDHALAPGGQFSGTGPASGTADCLQGNLCWALVALGCEDRRLEKAFDWLARSVTGEGIAPMTERDAAERYYAGKCGPTFACGSNNKLPCAWGAVKVMLALGSWPAAHRTPAMARAIAHGLTFLLDGDPARAGYPNGWAEKPSGNWWKFGFPVFYVTDLLQNVEALVALGCGGDSRLARAIDLIREKQDATGRWPLEYDYAGKTWAEFGPKKQPSPWVTIRALRVLKAVA
ncbi:MAG TPA: nitrogen fixation protein NifH [Anaerolineae bacterium]